MSFAAKPKPLYASEVLEQLITITKTKGDKAQGRKVSIIKALMVRCVDTEAKYLIRALQGKLRIGTAAQTVLVSLAHAFAHYSDVKKIEDINAAAAPAVTEAVIDGKEDGDEDEDKDEEDTTKNNDKKNSKKSEIVSTSTSTSTANTTVTEGITDLNELVNSLNETEPPEAKQLRKGLQRTNKLLLLLIYIL